MMCRPVQQHLNRTLVTVFLLYVYVLRGAYCQTTESYRHEHETSMGAEGTVLTVATDTAAAMVNASESRGKVSSLAIGVTRQVPATRQEPTNWGYGPDNGPSRWPSLGFNLCAGARQSPINIVPECTRRLLQPRPWIFTNYHIPIASATVGTTPNTVQYTSITDRRRSIEGSILESRYNLYAFHFHWGANSTVGSEHLINGRAGPLELHIVHLAEPYTTLEQTVADPRGIVVLGVIFEISQTENTAYRDLIRQVGESSGRAPMTNFNSGIVLASLLPSDLNTYYHYEGSLTTPTCDEVVQWFIFARPVPISEAQEQMATFRTLLAENQSPVINNFRPTQPLNTRMVFSTFSPPSRALVTVRTSLINYLFLRRKRILLICQP